MTIGETSSGPRLVTVSFITKKGVTIWKWSSQYGQWSGGYGIEMKTNFTRKRDAIYSAEEWLRDNGYVIVDQKFLAMI